MDILPNNANEIVNHVLDIVKSKQIKVKPYIHSTGENYYTLGEGKGVMVLENYDNESKSVSKGLLTTLYDSKNHAHVNDFLKWTDTFGRTTTRYQYNTLGKPISEIKKILDIAIKVNHINYHHSQEQKALRSLTKLMNE